MVKSSYAVLKKRKRKRKRKRKIEIETIRELPRQEDPAIRHRLSGIFSQPLRSS